MKARILVVDDEQHICDMLSRHFQYMGYEVFTASNGNKALEFLESNRVDVMISDIKMPAMDGVALLKQVRKEYPMISVIMMTGYVTMENALACLRYGADTCIFKPIEDMTELENAVKKAVEYTKHWQEKLKMLREMKPQTTGA